MKAMKLNFYPEYITAKLREHRLDSSFEIMTNARKITNNLIPHIGHPTLISPMTRNMVSVIHAEVEDQAPEKQYVEW
jgi:hypothetical protein